MRSALSAARRADGAAAGTLSALFLLLYLVTLCRTVYWYDSAEYATAAYTLGVPHPPGYPLYTLIAHAFTLLPLAPAHAVNLMSALFGALAVGLCFATSRALGANRPGAAAAGALLGSGDAFWLNATVAEVYTPGLCFAFGVVLLLLHASRRAKPRYALLAAALAGLGLGMHYSIATLGLGLSALAAHSALGACAGEPGRERARYVARVLWACALACAAGFALSCTYFVLVAADDGVPNYAQPSSLPRALWLLSGGNYRGWFLHAFASLDRVAYVAGLFADALSLAGCAAALAGLLGLALRARAHAAALALAIAGNAAFFFRYRVDDLQVFLLPGIALSCACAGVCVPAGPGRTLRAAALAVPVALAAVSLGRIAFAYERRDLSGFVEAQEYGERVSRELPHRAVILNYTTPEEWRYDAVFGMYFKHVLGRRPDAIVVKNADRPLIDRLLAEGRPVYLYTDVAHVAREYVLLREGALQRVVARR